MTSNITDDHHAYKSYKKIYYDMREVSDRLCKEYGLFTNQNKALRRPAANQKSKNEITQKFYSGARVKSPHSCFHALALCYTRIGDS